VNQYFLDSLEDWVPIKPNLFKMDGELSKRYIFMISWNDLNRKVAITCRLRNQQSIPLTDNRFHQNRNHVSYIQGKPIVIEVHQAGEVSEEKVMGESDTKFHE
jgi:hypothetical protein